MVQVGTKPPASAAIARCLSTKSKVQHYSDKSRSRQHGVSLGKPCASCSPNSGPMAVGPISTPWRAYATGKPLVALQPAELPAPVAADQRTGKFMLNTH